jgi:hypothetical protein
MPALEPAPTTLIPLLVVAITALAGVVGYLWRYYSKRDEVHGKEREEWHAERERWAVERERWDRVRAELRADYEARYREDYRQLLEDQRKHEEDSKRADADRMESIERITAEANAKVAVVLERIYERYIGPGPRKRD